MAGSKGYRARLKLGYTTPSYDAETPEEPFVGTIVPTSTSALEAALPNFRGTIHQRPPLFSALKIGGQTLYKLARKGQEVEIPTRPVVVESLEIDSFDPAMASVELSISCGKGTYIRSLAHDLGSAWGCGAYLTALRRTQVGPWKEADAWSLANLLEALHQRETAQTGE
jgi:tRNA pseudouridine55 synthase